MGPLVALSVLIGQNIEISWPDVDKGRSIGLTIPLGQPEHGKGTKAPQSVVDYYDQLAENYDAAVQAWGYFLPEASTDALFKHTNIAANPEVHSLHTYMKTC